MLQRLEGISRYELVRCIAQGGMGAVYQAKQIGPDGFEKNVAIKTILPKYLSSEQFIRMFIGKAKPVANLVHENIVEIYQLGKSDESFYIAMEYVEGINLKQFIEAHRQQHKSLPFDKDSSAPP